MHQIYSMADSVLIWLGEANEESDIVMDFVEKVSNSEINPFESPPVRNGYLKHIPELARSWAAFHKLLLRSYFRRLWVVQEVATASTSTAICGSKS